MRWPDQSPQIQNARTAFVKLESAFPNPNSIVLMSYRSYWRDTVIDERADTIHRIYFTYLQGKKVHYTKMMVLGDSAVIDSLDMPGRPAKLFPGWHFAFLGRNLSSLEDVKKTLKDEPQWGQDSVIRILSQ